MTEQPHDTPYASIQEDGLEQYLLHGRLQIRQLLQELIDARSLISVHLVPGGLSFLSTIVTLSEDEEWLFLDTSPNETIHRRCLQAEWLLCVTQLHKIRIQFRVSRSMEIPVDDRLALAAVIPEEVLRLQRRDTFRLQVPLSHDLKCILPVLDRHSNEEHQKKRLEAPVIDISAGGLSLEIPPSKNPPNVGDQIYGCHLKLPDDLIGITLEIRNHGRRIRSNGKEVLRLGCRFVDLPAQSSNHIQRYIYQAEREIRSHEA